MIATSNAQNDAGLFELNFRDEHYLPFEGAGAISRWRIELSKFQQFDWNTITDVVMHLRYMARNGRKSLKEQTGIKLEENFQVIASSSQEDRLARMFSIRHEFPTEWYRFTNSESSTSTTLELSITKDRCDRISFHHMLLLGLNETK